MKPATRHIARLCAGLFVCAAIATQAQAQTQEREQQIPVASLQRTCELLASRLRSISVQSCVDSGLKVDGIASVNGLPLLYRDYLPTSRLAPPHRVLLLGGIHGDELSAMSLVFEWMQRIDHERFQPFHWRVIPCLNPDGLLADPPTRVNANGVDLNRNFPARDWDSEALRYWKQRARGNPRRYPGPRALSEPETRALADMIRQFQPEAIVSVHAPYDLLDFDGPRKPPLRFGYLDLHQLGTYPGSLGDYAGVDLGLPVITLELPSAGTMPTPPQVQRIWEDMLGWLTHNLPRHPAPQYLRLGDHPWSE